MPTINYQGQYITCSKGENLRRILLKNNLSPYNGVMHYLNCRGIGSCGTCAVKIQGEVNPKTKMEKWRLNFPPHQIESGLRLACQVKVTDDLIVEKGEGLWGEK